MKIEFDEMGPISQMDIDLIKYLKNKLVRLKLYGEAAWMRGIETKATMKYDADHNKDSVLWVGDCYMSKGEPEGFDEKYNRKTRTGSPLDQEDDKILDKIFYGKK